MNGFCLRFPNDIWSSLQSTLFKTYEKETKSFLGCKVIGAEPVTLMPVKLFEVPLSGYVSRGKYEVVTDPALILKLLEACELEELALLEAHTHPWADDVSFSSIDLLSDPKKFRATQVLPAPFRHASIVLGRDRSLDGHIWNPKIGNPEPLLEAKVLSAPVTTLKVRGRHPLQGASPNLYLRQANLFGVAGQQILQSIEVAIVGCGGLGTQVAQALAYLGVRKFILIDPDRLELSNANRVVGITVGECDQGKPKVQALADSLYRLFDEHICIRHFMSKVQNEDVLKALESCSLICGCVDSVSARQFLNRLSCSLLIPYIDGGCGLQVDGTELVRGGGQVQVIIPGFTACRACIDRDQESEIEEHLSPVEKSARNRMGYVTGADVKAPQVVFLNGIVGNLMAWEAVKLFTACSHVHPYSYVDIGSSLLFPVQDVERIPDCVCCSLNGWLAAGSLDITSSLAGWNASASIPPYEG